MMRSDDVSLRWVLQPIVDNFAPASVCAEVLLRGQSEQGDAVRPDYLILEAEGSGRILALDQWVSLSVLHWIESHLSQLQRVGFISVNMSAKTLSDERSLDFILKDFQGFSPAVRHLACFEITETARISDISQARRAIVDFQKLGARVALDDYGSGYANEELLRQLPVDMVKLSGELMKKVDTDSRARAAVSDAIRLIHYLNASCVVEHIETDGDIEFVQGLGARFMQGFALARPMEASAFLQSAQSMD